MISTFRGRFESKLDQKGRLLIPAGYRDADFANATFVITNSQFQNQRCLDVYSLQAWQDLENKMSRMSQFRSEVQAFQRFYLSSGQLVTPDSHNRIVIPPSLRQYAGLKADVQLVGLSHKFEIWAQTEWNKLFKGLAQDFTQTLAEVARLDAGDEESR